MHAITHSLRRRLLGAAGLAALTGCRWDFGDDCSGWDGSYSYAVPVVAALLDEADDCPENPYYAWDRFEAPPDAYCDGLDTAGAGDIVDVRFVARAGVECSYELTCEGYEECPGGRPLQRDGASVLATAMPRADWQTERAPSIAELSDEERTVLREYWFRAGTEEHSSIAAFHRVALELLSLGAPADLVERATRAAQDESGHARDAFALASAYAGTAIGPSALGLGTDVSLATDLVALAVSTAREGAINECLAAYLAAERLRRATDPAVRAVLARVVEEETQHAELAWATLRWCLAQGGSTVRDALREVFATMTLPRAEARPWPAALEAHGVLSPADECACLSACIERVLRPVAASLLAQTREER
ncbi:MAG: ferritin-like domain-containing protein [Deltaproteobacteria bacterium]|nr:MAG: ferritin-like domain-containing protein [Deltaproteobacteria bacterium]